MTNKAAVTRVASLSELKARGRLVVKPGGKQIVLFNGESGVHACNNRCPHEGYPLSEGDLNGGCVLTCNWHNWKFDLESGETLVGGDKLRRYPVTLKGDDILLDLSDPPPEQAIAQAMENLRDSFVHHERRQEYDRMAREIARVEKAGGDPLDALRAAIRWTHEHLEFGTTHALAAAPDWLKLQASAAPGSAAGLVPLLETIGHLAWDTLREDHYPYATGTADYDPQKLFDAIEDEDQAAAVAILRGGLKDGLNFTDIEEPLTRAALAHYADFGHSLIYTVKAGQLIEALGPETQEPILLALVRSLIFATREDLIPEFRRYAKTLAAWDGGGRAPVKTDDFAGLNINRALDRTVASSGRPEELFDALLGILARDMLHFDLDVQGRTDRSVSHNVGWLDFTHGLTFANAAWMQCAKFPELWPQALLQMACFAGRNTAYVDRDYDASAWQVVNGRSFLKQQRKALFDHAQTEYIVSAHLVKILTAVSEDVAARPDAPWADDIVAAVNRFVHSPLKRKHSLRSARQALAFVAKEG